MNHTNNRAQQTTAPRPGLARARYLTQSIRLEEKPPPGIISAAIFLTVALLLAGMVWASVTDVNETAHAPGEIVPAGLSISVQHLEGGLVKALHVREGDQVKRGEPLLQLDDSALHSELSQMRFRQLALELQAERLAALLENRPAAFDPVAGEYESLVTKQQTIYQAQLNSHQREIQVVDSQIAQKEQERVRQKNQVLSIQKEVALLEEQVRLRTELTRKKLVSRTELLTTQSRLAEAQGELRRAKDGVLVATSALEEARQRRLEAEAVFLRDIELEAGRVASELAEVGQAVLRLRDRIERVTMYAPVDGIVQNLTLSSGQVVVDPGQVILQVIPTADDLIVNARVSPTDIGHVKPGDWADVSVDSYDTVRFGMLRGEVRRLSATTYLDDQGHPYYRAEIALVRDHLGSDERPLRIIPGMTVKVDIRTGTKTLMAYLLRPVQRGLSTAFGER